MKRLPICAPTSCVIRFMTQVVLSEEELMTQIAKEYMSVSEVARLCKRSKTVIEHQILTGKLTAYRCVGGRERMIRTEDAVKFSKKKRPAGRQSKSRPLA